MEGVILSAKMGKGPLVGIVIEVSGFYSHWRELLPFSFFLLPVKGHKTPKKSGNFPLVGVTPNESVFFLIPFTCEILDAMYFFFKKKTLY